MPRTYTLDEAREIANKLEIDFESAGFDVDQFLAGLDVEAEHGVPDSDTNVTDDDGLTTGKIALAHLKEMPDYYARLEEMESGANARKPGGARPFIVTGVVLGVAAVLVAVVVAMARRRSPAPVE